MSLRPPNVLLIMSDQQRADSMGYARREPSDSDTPHLDALARRGVIFETAYSSSTSCVPARTSLMTGLLHHRVPLAPPAPHARTRQGQAVREGYWTIAHALQAGGYDTALFGKMHFQPMRAKHGFQTMRICEHLPAGYDAAESDDYRHWLTANGLDDVRFLQPATPRVFPYALHFHPTRWVTQACQEYLADPRRRERPWFVVASYPDPHTPYLPPASYMAMYPPEQEQLPEEGVDVNDDLPWPLRDAAMVDTPGNLFTPLRTERLSQAHKQSVLAAIRAAIRHIDDVVALLLESLDLDNTVVVYLSDHGDYGGHRGYLGKVPWIPFDDLARVPFFVAGAGVQGGRRISAPVQSFDFVPTVMELVGLTPPAGLDGVSLAPVLRGTAADEEREVYCSTTEGWPMLRCGDFKLIWHAGANTHILYNMKDDPGETRNLAARPEHRAFIAKKTAVLRDLMGRTSPDLWLR